MSDLPVYLVPTLARARAHSAKSGYLKSRVAGMSGQDAYLECEKWRQLDSLGFVKLGEEKTALRTTDGCAIEFPWYFEIMPAGKYVLASYAAKFAFWGGACVLSAFLGALVGRALG